jgi:hypothetical protein
MAEADDDELWRIHRRAGPKRALYKRGPTAGAAFYTLVKQSRKLNDWRNLKLGGPGWPPYRRARTAVSGEKAGCGVSHTDVQRGSQKKFDRESVTLFFFFFFFEGREKKTVVSVYTHQYCARFSPGTSETTSSVCACSSKEK